MTSDYQLIMHTLEVVAENDVDITATVYQRLFANSPDAEEVFSATPKNQRGTMVNKVIEMIVAHADGSSDMIEFREYDIPMHDELGVTPKMYWDYFNALMGAFESVLGEQWNRAQETAWKNQFSQLVDEVYAHSENED